MSVSLQENEVSHKDMLIEMEKFKTSNLNNQELSDKLKCNEEEMATLKATSMEMESQLKDSQNTIMSLQEDLKAFEMENKEMADKWKKDINSWEVLKNKFQLVQRELNTLQQRPGSNDSESQQNWETDSAFQSAPFIYSRNLARKIRISTNSF